MPCRHIIHTVGPVWRGGEYNEADLLAACYRSSLKVAMDNGIRTIAFPSISTGIFSYPVEEAAYIAVNTVIDFLKENPGKFVFVQSAVKVHVALFVFLSAAAPADVVSSGYFIVCQVSHSLNML